MDSSTGWSYIQNHIHHKKLLLKSNRHFSVQSLAVFYVGNGPGNR